MLVKQLLLVLALLVPAGGGMWLAAPREDLPPRPDPPAGPTATAVPQEGGVIILQPDTAEPVSPDWWIEVEWQNGQGEWFKVDGWRGTFNPDGRVVWWVGPEHLGQGPFRWLVYAAVGDETPLAISPSFYLPEKAGETVLVTVSLPSSE